ncbi:hypothetical protein [Halorubrum sp. SP9]|uniref:hypothetical protein n=4 Tax=unclassified Halorubrum TaxID=2642239 RepID=UPI0010F63A22|nr:hypothetical protein [Halorubrum sp. SP9]TKX69264.1 hypothetical protein EXE45_09105 [Halorubrum sp. SP9]
MTRNKALKPLSDIISCPETINGAIDLEDAETDAEEILRTFILTEDLEKHLLTVLNDLQEERGGTYWLQGEFGSGKSHVLATLYSLLLADDQDSFDLLESDAISTLGTDIHSKDVLVVPFSLAGGGDAQLSLHKNIIRYTQDAYREATGDELPVSADERLLEEFNSNDKIRKESFYDFLSEQTGEDWDAEQWEAIDQTMFADSLRSWLHDSGFSLDIDEDFETSFTLALERVLEDFDHVVYIIDEISEFLNRRGDQGARTDEDVLFTLANLKDDFPLTMIAAAQQSYEQRDRVKGQRGKLIAEDRWQNLTLTRTPQQFSEIAVRRTITEHRDDLAIEEYYDYYEGRFTWLDGYTHGEFRSIFPYTEQTLDLTNKASVFDNTNRTGIMLLHNAVKHHGDEASLITPVELFDELAAVYPDVTTNALMTNFPDFYNNYQQTVEDYLPRLDEEAVATDVVKVLLLYAITRQGCTAEDVTNALMNDAAEKASHNEAYYQSLLEEIANTVPFVVNENGKFQFQKEEEITIDQDLATEVDGLSRDEARDEFHMSMREFGQFSTVGDETSVDVLWEETNTEVRGLLTANDFRDWKSLTEPEDFDDQRFWVYIQTRPAEDVRDEVEYLLDDERVLLWVPRDLTDRQINKFKQRRALRRLIDSYDESDDPHAGEKYEMAVSRKEELEAELDDLVNNAYRNGTVFTSELDDIDFAFQPTLENTIRNIVQEPLDRAYPENELEFREKTPWRDGETNKILDGIVKHGGVTSRLSSRFESAAHNYGQGLKITTQANPNRLDLSDNPYTEEIVDIVESDSDQQVPVERIHNKFRTTPYGLSGRIIAIYILSLVQKGELEATVDSDIIEGGVVTSTNIEDAEFTGNDLASDIDAVQIPTGPEHWDDIVTIADTLLSERVSRDRKQTTYIEVWNDIEDRIESLEDDIPDLIDRYERVCSSVDVDPELTDELSTVEAVVSQTYAEQSASANLERLYNRVTIEADSVADFVSAVETVSDTESFLNDYESVVNRASQAFRDWEDDDIAEAAADVEDKLEFPEVVENDVAASDLKSAVDSFEETYQQVYRSEHIDYNNQLEAVHEEIDERLNSEAFTRLRILNQSDYNFATDERAEELRKKLEALRPQDPCRRSVSDQLKGGSLTCACGFELGETYEKPDFSHLEPREYLERGVTSLQEFLPDSDEETEVEIDSNALEAFLDADVDDLISKTQPEMRTLITEIDNIISSLNTVVEDITVGTDAFEEPVSRDELSRKTDELEQQIEREITTVEQENQGKDVLVRIHFEGDESSE